MFLISLDFKSKLRRDSEIPKGGPNILGNCPPPPPPPPSGAIFFLLEARVQEYFIFVAFLWQEAKTNLKNIYVNF